MSGKIACTQVDALSYLAHDGELEASARHQLEQHLLDCDSCARRHRQLGEHLADWDTELKALGDRLVSRFDGQRELPQAPPVRSEARASVTVPSNSADSRRLRRTHLSAMHEGAAPQPRPGVRWQRAVWAAAALVALWLGGDLLYRAYVAPAAPLPSSAPVRAGMASIRWQGPAPAVFRGQERFELAELDTFRLHDLDDVQVPAGASAVVELDDGSRAHMESATDFTLSFLKPPQPETYTIAPPVPTPLFRLQRGQGEFFCRKRSAGMRVVTPVATVVVTGTVFTVSYDEAARVSVVRVSEGEVRVGNRSVRAGQAVVANEREVSSFPEASIEVTIPGTEPASAEGAPASSADPVIPNGATPKPIDPVDLPRLGERPRKQQRAAAAKTSGGT